MTTALVPLSRAQIRLERERLAWDNAAKAIGGVKDLATNPVVLSFAGLVAAQYLMNKRYEVEDVRNVKIVDEPAHWGMGTGLWGLPQFMWIPERYHMEKQVIGTARIPYIDETAGKVLQASLGSSAFLAALGSAGEGFAGILGAIKGLIAK